MDHSFLALSPPGSGTVNLDSLPTNTSPLQEVASHNNTQDVPENLESLPPNSPPIIIVNTLPPEFVPLYKPVLDKPVGVYPEQQTDPKSSVTVQSMPVNSEVSQHDQPSRNSNHSSHLNSISSRPPISPTTSTGNATGLVGAVYDQKTIPSNSINNTAIPFGSSQPTSNNPPGTSGRTIALGVLAGVYIILVSGLLLWRSWRKKQNKRRKNASEIGEVHQTERNPKSQNSPEVEKKDIHTMYPSNTDDISKDASYRESGRSFGRKGIVRSTRPTSLLLKEAPKQLHHTNTILASSTMPAAHSHRYSSGQQDQHRSEPEPSSHSTGIQDRSNSLRSSIAVAWASLGIPNDLLGETQNLPITSTIAKSNSGSTAPVHQPPVKIFHICCDAVQSLPEEVIYGAGNHLKKAFVSKLIAKEEDHLTPSFDIKSSTYQTDGLKSCSTLQESCITLALSRFSGSQPLTSRAESIWSRSERPASCIKIVNFVNMGSSITTRISISLPASPADYGHPFRSDIPIEVVVHTV